MAAVDSSLFGERDAVRAAAQKKREGSSQGQIRITKEKLAALRAPTAIASPDELSQAKAAKLNEAAHRLVAARQRLASQTRARCPVRGGMPCVLRRRASRVLADRATPHARAKVAGISPVTSPDGQAERVGKLLFPATAAWNSLHRLCPE